MPVHKALSREANSGAESIAVDDEGRVYRAETGGKILRQLVKQ